MNVAVTGRLMNRVNRVAAACAPQFVAENDKPVTNDGGRRRWRRWRWRSGGAVEVLGAVLTLLSVVFILFTFPVTGWMCAKVIREYERAVIFRLGRAVEGRAKGPGLFWFIPWLDVIQKVDLRTVSFNIHPQEVDAVVFYRVVDPSSWVTRVENGYEAIHTLAQTTLRAALGTHTLTDVLTQRTGVVRRMEEALYAASTLWGVQVERVEIKDLSLPVDLQRCMASEAEAARRARAKMIMAEGEVKASHALKEAASGLSPVAYHLRYLQSLSSVQSSASIVVFSLPAELLNMFISHQPQDVSAAR